MTTEQETTQQGPLSERVSRLEGAYEHLATKADVAEVKAEVARVEARIAELQAELARIEIRLLRWLLPGIAIGGAIGGVVSRLLS